MTSAETVERVRAEPGDYDRLTAPIAEVKRVVRLGAAAEAAEERVRVLEQGVASLDAELAGLGRAAEDREAQRGAAEAGRRAAAEAKDVSAIKDHAGTLAALEVMAELDAERRASLEAQRGDLVERLVPDAVRAAQDARATAAAAYSGKQSRRAVDLVVLATVRRLAEDAFNNKLVSEDGGEDAIELLADLAGLADQVARDAFEDAEGLAVALAAATRVPDAAEDAWSPEYALKMRIKADEVLQRAQRLHDAKLVGNRGIQEAASIQADTNFILSTGIGGR